MHAYVKYVGAVNVRCLRYVYACVVCACVFIHAYAHEYMCACMHVCMYVSMHARACAEKMFMSVCLHV